MKNGRDCPKCGRCPFPDGTCEEVVSRGRRFFLMGALALPVAMKIERLGDLVKPVSGLPDQVVLGFDQKLAKWCFQDGNTVGFAEFAWRAQAT